MTPTLELLHVTPETGRAYEALDALAKAATRAGARVAVSTKYDGSAPWLLLWGPGAPDRQAAIRKQVASGGHAIALDLAYWSRDRKVRVSFDGPHPQAYVMLKSWPRSRFASDPVHVDNLWNPRGPVVVAGIGEKATVQYGAAVVKSWEAEQARAAEAAGYRVVSRPKKPIVTPIETALRGAAAVITYHSNVAVDAIRLGVPAICRDGAAAAVCTSSWPADLHPLPGSWRDGFLSNLAWFQWDLATEAKACWRWIEEVLE